MHLVHFADLKSDFDGEVRKIAEFCGIEIKEDAWEKIKLHCSFDYMKEHATASTPLGGAFWDQGSKVFVNKV